MKPLLTEENAAKRLGLAAVTLRLWRTAGKGPPHVRLGSSIRYEPEVLAAWVEAQRVPRLTTDNAD